MWVDFEREKTLLARKKALHEYGDMNKFSSNLFGLPNRDKFGLTSLHWVCLNDDLEGLKLLAKTDPEFTKNLYSPRKYANIFDQVLLTAYEFSAFLTRFIFGRFFKANYSGSDLILRVPSSAHLGLGFMVFRRNSDQNEFDTLRQ